MSKMIGDKKEPVTVLIPVGQINMIRKLQGLAAEAELVFLMMEAVKEVGFVDLLDNPKSDTLRLDMMFSWVVVEEEDHEKS